jgi:hypothetical protein
MQCKEFFFIEHIWIRNFIFLVSSELMQQRQRVGDLEEELDLLKKQLNSTQTKVIKQVKDFKSKISEIDHV